MSTKNKLLIVSVVIALVGCGEDSAGARPAHEEEARETSSASSGAKGDRSDGAEEREWEEEMVDDGDAFLDEEEIIHDSTPRAPARLSLPDALVGSWYAGAGLTSQPYDSSTGSYGLPSGDGVLYTFKADGTYQKAFRGQVSSAGCTTGLSAYEAGVAQLDGATLRLVPMTGSLSYRDSCVPSLSSDKPATELEEESFQYLRSGDTLELSRSDGARSVFHAVVQQS